MISPRTVIPLSADAAGADVPAAISPNWKNIGHIAEAVWDEANRAKDRQDEALDAMRVSGGMTLDEYLETAR